MKEATVKKICPVIAGKLEHYKKTEYTYSEMAQLSGISLQLISAIVRLHIISTASIKKIYDAGFLEPSDFGSITLSNQEIEYFESIIK